MPITVKMPDPITAPMPSAVNETGPSVFFNACSGLSDSEISLSIDLVRKICLASALAPAYRGIGAGRFNESERCSLKNAAFQFESGCLPLALTA